MPCPCCNPNPNPCDGPCDTLADCAPGCDCVEEQCVQADPCKIIVNNLRKGIGQIDWKVALDASCWGGSVYPGRVILTTDNGDGAVVDVDIPYGWTWFRNDSFVHKFGEPGFDGYESKKLSCTMFYAPALVGPYTDGSGSWSFNYNEDNDDGELDIHVKEISETACILYGHVGVEYAFSPKTDANEYTPEQLQQRELFNQTWRWQATITNGVLGGVSIVAVAGVRSINGGQNVSGTFGPTPEVTITL